MSIEDIHTFGGQDPETLKPVADELLRRMAAEPSEGPFEFSWFCRADGEPIATVADVVATLTQSAEKSTRAELWGVSLAERDEDGKQLVVCYTGNGPRSQANARLIAQLLNDYRTVAAPASGAPHEEP